MAKKVVKKTNSKTNVSKNIKENNSKNKVKNVKSTPVKVIDKKEEKKIDEQLKKNNLPESVRLLIGFIIFAVLLLAVITAVYSNFNKKEDSGKKPYEDSEKFKKEYESVNDKINENNGNKYLSLKIDDKNPIKFVTEEEALNIIKEKSGIVYFGFKTCPWCRALLPSLLETAKENNIKDIYYLDIQDIRSSLELNEKNEIVVLQNGTKGYHNLLAALDKYLEPYVLETAPSKKGKTKKIDTGQKRIYAPTLVFVKNGEIKGVHTGTISNQKDPYVPLTDKQKETLNKTLDKFMKQIANNVCTTKEC